MIIRRTVLYCVAALAALSLGACTVPFSGKRNSPKALELERVNAFLVQVLQRKAASPGQLQREMAEKFSSGQIYFLAMTCRTWAVADTADPPGSLEDAETLKFCFFECAKVLKARGSLTYLRHVFRDGRVDDGWRMLWYESLGADWLKAHPFVMPEP